MKATKQRSKKVHHSAKKVHAASKAAAKRKAGR